MENKPYIELIDISKTFGNVVANDHICFSVRKGEIHALLGENGSGKSTLVNMLSGIYKPDSGAIYLDGRRLDLNSPADAIHAGIGMVHQHFKLIDVFTGMENIIIGQKNGLFIHGRAVSKSVAAYQNKYGLQADLGKKVYRMSVGEKQAVEIIKVLFRGADVLILDEPTAVLTPQEIRKLFEILRKMREQGCAIILITHKLNEVLAISDRVTVLRKGRSIGTVETDKTDMRKLTEMMVGRPISLLIERAVTEKQSQPMLTVKDLTIKDPDGLFALDHVGFDLFGGEILGVAGIAGSGQKELCETIAGLMRADYGEIVFQGEPIMGMTPRDIIRKGVSMSFIPEDRLGMGLVGGMDIVDNVMLKSYQNKPGPFIDRKEGRKIALRIVDKFNISTPGVTQTVKNLSGGNIQKVLLGREIELNPRLLITAYPVRGLDIGASYNIYDILNEQKKKGVAILFIGEDLDVLLELCDRIMILNAGRIMDIVDAARITKEEVGLLMLGRLPEKEGDANAENH